MVDSFLMVMVINLFREELNRFLKEKLEKIILISNKNLEFVLCIDRMEVIDRQFGRF